MRVVVLVGNPNRGGRTTTVAEAVAARIADMTGAAVETVELIDVAGELFDWGSAAVNELAARVRTTEILVVASPTYKASFTGLLKAFLDRYRSDGLSGVVTVPVMLGGSPTHALAVETQLRPVLVELGAVMPTRGLYVVDSEMDSLANVIDAWWETASPGLRRSLTASG
ncbi:MAG: NAD(P)H-dependent oxidoreductase [Acidimicrobiia bacterium]|nr:NAD(P)H-dependent oxidoreductase [Acidimicrobiia bacterium]